MRWNSVNVPFASDEIDNCPRTKENMTTCYSNNAAELKKAEFSWALGTCDLEATARLHLSCWV